MGLKEDIKSKVKEYLEAGKYDTKEIEYIPDKSDSNITFGNKGVTLTGTALHIDMRNSTTILKNHHKDTIAKIHKGYLHIAAKIVQKNKGYIRSFNGDGMLAFFPKDLKGTIWDAVRASMEIKYMIATECSSYFSKYDALDFGIGIHHGKMLVVKTGLAGDNNNDLLWIGEPVNFAVKMGDGSKAPNNIRISSFVYNNLLDEVKFVVKKEKDWFGNEVEKKINMWTKIDNFEFGGENKTIYETSYYWTVS